MIEVAQGVLDGSRRALARMLTSVENEREGVHEALAMLYPHTGQAWIIGVTGAPGTGKSTLVNALALAYRRQEKTVAVLAVDPTSPFSGGAILGDRIRMRDLSGDAGVFIRSMATRGNLGGLARAAGDAVRVLDAAGFDIILVETVGAGQSEVDIVSTAQTTLVVDAPGMGDDVQAIKAGILEIADVLVVNKADRPGADNTVRGLKAMLELGHPSLHSRLSSHHGQLLPVQAADDDHNRPLWIPPIIKTIAADGGGSAAGIDEVMAAVVKHRDYLAQADIMTALERQHIEIELFDRLRDTLMTRLLTSLSAEAIADVVARVQARKLDPHSAVQELLTRV